MKAALKGGSRVVVLVGVKVDLLAVAKVVCWVD